LEQLEGRTAIVTGASTGIGRSVALELARLGVRVVMVSRDRSRLDAAVEEVHRLGGEAAGITGDLGDLAAVDEVVDEALRVFGTPHIVVNNAGVFAPGYSWDIAPAHWEWVLAVNLLAPIRMVNALLPRMLVEPEGHIVNVASVGGLLGPPPGHAPYAVSKHGLVGFSKALKADLALRHANIGVTCVCPGAVATAITGQLDTNGPGGVPRGHLALPPEIREVVDQVAASTDAGVSPDSVAPMVVDAIRSNRFWLLPNADRFLRGIDRELEDLKARR
jgi:NAD(P)-dependent dehydrogenase (short-subunit alcohol dehydrogenase family)